MERTIEWTLGNGKKATYTIKLQLEKEVDLDGDKIFVPCCEIDTRIDVEGVNTFISSDIEIKNITIAGTECVAVIGKKVAIGKEIYDRLMQAKMEFEAHPAMVAKIAKKTVYTKSEKGSGYCYKCGSYCYGDCGR